MSSLASYAALAAKFDDTLRAQNRPRQLRRSQAGGWRRDFQSQRATIFTLAAIDWRRFSEQPTGHGWTVISLAILAAQGLQAQVRLFRYLKRRVSRNS